MDKNDLKRLKEVLPRHPNILGKEKFFNAAVLIPLVEKDGEYSFLFQKRSPHIRQGGEICFPGGEYEPTTDENCMQTAIRETQEELGVNREQIEIVGRLDTLISPRGITVDSFIGILKIPSLDVLKLDRYEVDRVFLLSVSWFEQHEPKVFRVKTEVKPYYYNDKGEKVVLFPAKDLGISEKYSKPWDGMEYRVLVYETPEDVIWGITADLVYEVIRKIQKSKGV